MRTLYLCYFGLREPLVQTQVLPYLRWLARDGMGVYLLTFEPKPKERWTTEEIASWTNDLRKVGIEWSFLTYHKRPSLPATAFDMLVGGLVATRLVRRHAIDVIHGRAHIAAVMGGIAKLLTGRKLIFDIRGLIPEEYVDAGVWPAGGLKYRLTKRMERWLLRTSDAFVMLTKRGRDLVFPGCGDSDDRGRPIEIIPCCVDLERFRAAEAIARDQVRAELGVGERYVLVYVGAMGGFYLTDELVRFLAVAHERDPAAFSMILTQSPAAMIEEPLRAAGVDPANVLIRKVAPAEIPRYLKAADVALSFIKPSYSKIASSPTKIAEYLAAGLPVINNAEIGDLDEMIEADRVGVIVREFHRQAFLDALREADLLLADPDTAARCRASAESRFDLERIGVAGYRRLYDRLTRATEAAPPRLQEVP